MMAATKPIMSEKVLKDIFTALVEANVVPYEQMVNELSKATKKDDYQIRLLYTDRYKQIKEVDTDPFVPASPIVG